ncbi:MAG: hypothetical protein COA78_13670 [Blastopirellula sp.]|nr:MAG: hypothetical protein COA78_13670 [Blastopirellula sp.]
MLPLLMQKMGDLIVDPRKDQMAQIRVDRVEDLQDLAAQDFAGLVADRRALPEVANCLPS